MALMQHTDFEVMIPEAAEGVAASPTTSERINWKGNLKYALVGIIFVITFTKAEVISWFRIQEMFRLQSFHMYGVIGTAMAVGMLSVFLIKRFKLKTMDGETIEFPKKKFQKGQVIGELLFGFGWAMTGPCPGSLFAQIGAGFGAVVVVFAIAMAEN